MNSAKTAICGIFALGFASTAANAITIDGTFDSAFFGSPTATVTYDPAAPESNFGGPNPPTMASDSIGYSIYLVNQANTLYGYVQSSGPGTAAGTFANLYFGGTTNPPGSTIGFEITNHDVFTPGAIVPPSVIPSLYQAATSSDGTGIEFAIPDSVFEGPIGTTGIDAGFAPGDIVQLRLSQSFGYSVAGPDLGTFILAGAVPEPSTWAMMILGFAGIGAMTYRRRKSALLAA